MCPCIRQFVHLFGERSVYSETRVLIRKICPCMCSAQSLPGGECVRLFVKSSVYSINGRSFVRLFDNDSGHLRKLVCALHEACHVGNVSVYPTIRPSVYTSIGPFIRIVRLFEYRSMYVLCTKPARWEMRPLFVDSSVYSVIHPFIR